MKKILIILTIIAAPWYLSAQSSMDIEDGAEITIGVDASITTGAITNGASTAGDGLIIKSTSAGSGSLICTGTPTATVERFIEYDASGRWNMVSPSTTGITGQTFFDANNGSDSWLTYYDESTGTNGGDPGEGWEYLTTLGDAVNVGQGYSYWTSADETVNFKGNLQSADLTPTITWTDGDHGYNLIGNPFSSAVEWNTDASWGINATDMEGTIWIFDNTGSNYASYTQAATHNIAMGQGFFVRAKTSSGSITIPESQRNHDASTFLKNGGNEGIGAYENALIIKANNNQSQDKVQISFQDNGTEDFDNGWDGTKMFGSEEAPQLYLVEGELNQSFDHLPTLVEGEERTVAMSYIAGAAGEQKLIANFTYFTGVDVTLEDLKTGDTQNLSENSTYSFTGSKDDSPERFLLHFAWSPDGIGDEFEDVSSNINIYAYDNKIYIRSSDEAINQNGNVFVYDLMGRELAQHTIEGTELIKFPVNITNNYVVVKVVKDGSTKTQKVYIK